MRPRLRPGCASDTAVPAGIVRELVADHWPDRAISGADSFSPSIASTEVCSPSTPSGKSAMLQAITADPPVSRAKRSVAAYPGRNEPKPKVSRSGKRVVRKVLDDRDD
jgi:hypothetical protein